MAVGAGLAVTDDLQSILDYFECATMEAVENLHEALDALRRELLDDESGNDDESQN